MKVLKCGCVFDGKSFKKYCREHGLMVLQKRWEKWQPAKKDKQGQVSMKGEL